MVPVVGRVSAGRLRLLVELARMVLAPALTLSSEPEGAGAGAGSGERGFSCDTNPALLWLWPLLAACFARRLGSYKFILIALANEYSLYIHFHCAVASVRDRR